MVCMIMSSTIESGPRRGVYIMNLWSPCTYNRINRMNISCDVYAYQCRYMTVEYGRWWWLGCGSPHTLLTWIDSNAWCTLLTILHFRHWADEWARAIGRVDDMTHSMVNLIEFFDCVITLKQRTNRLRVCGTAQSEIFPSRNQFNFFDLIHFSFSHLMHSAILVANDSFFIFSLSFSLFLDSPDPKIDY